MTHFSIFASGTVALFATHKYFEYAYPRKTIEFDNYIKWQTVRVYTLSEMATREFRNCTSSKISSSLKTFFPSYIDSECIILSKNGNVEVYPTLSNIPGEKNALDHDLVINKCETPSGNEKHDYNMLRFKEVSDITHSFKASSVKFLAIQLKLEGKKAIPIDFGKNNFYIDGNVLFDRPFIVWLLRGNSSVEIINSIKHGSSYDVEFINHKMNCDRITSKQCIVIGEDDYSVLESTDTTDPEGATDTNSGWDILDRSTKDLGND